MLSGVHSIEWFGVQALGCPVVWSLGYRLLPLRAVSHEYGNQSGGLLLQNRQSCGLSLRSGRNLARVSAFCEPPWNPCLRDQRAPAAAWARGDPATPAGVRIVVLFYPGVRCALPRLISFRPAGAEYVTVFVKSCTSLPCGCAMVTVRIGRSHEWRKL